MTRVNEIASIALKICASLALLALGVLFAQWREISITEANSFDLFVQHATAAVQDIDDRANDLRAPIAGVSDMEKKAGAIEDAALARVNDLQAPIHSANDVEQAALARVNEFKAPIAETHSLLFDARASVAEMNRAALAERKYFEVQIPATTAKLDAAIEGLLPVETNAASTLGSVAAISDDGRKVIDKETADFFKPTPWYMKPVKRFGEIWDIAAAVARHTP